MNVFYLSDATEGMVSFPEEESKHCVKVLRMQEGDRFCVTDGKGSLYDGELVEAHPKRVPYASQTNARVMITKRSDSR
jgi:16S rRNA (uracil1498-N3)-methyltransferase